MSLPETWIDVIFAKLTLIYGRDFHSRWEGVNIADVKADWAHELSGLEHNPQAVAYALEHLPPSRPPTVLEFRELARKAPKPVFIELPAPMVDRQRLGLQMQKLAHLKALAVSPQDPKSWARRLLSRHQAGEPITPTCLRMARQALAKVPYELP